MYKPYFALFFIAMVCGCAAPSADPIYGADYDVGYNHGCQTAATGDRTRLRDDLLYKANAAYKAGWNNGYGVCQNENVNQRDPMRDILIDPNR